MITAEEALKNVNDYRVAKEQEEYIWRTTLNKEVLEDINQHIEKCSLQGNFMYAHSNVPELNDLTMNYLKDTGYKLGYLNGNTRELILCWETDEEKINEYLTKNRIIIEWI